MITNRPRINNLAELHTERANLRTAIIVVEDGLKLHYTIIAERVQSVTKIFGVVSKFNKLIGIGEKKSDQDDDGSPSYLNTTVKVAIPLIAGGILLAGRKRILIKSMLWYGLGQAAKYVVSKNMDEHISTVKNIFSSKSGESDNKGIF